MGKLSRDKGKAHERLVARTLRAIFPGARRCRQINEYNNTVDVPDVEAGPFDVECKHQKGVSHKAAVREAKQFVRAGRAWAVVAREHGARVDEIEITMPLSSFVALCEMLMFTTPAEIREANTEWWHSKI